MDIDTSTNHELTKTKSLQTQNTGLDFVFVMRNQSNLDQVKGRGTDTALEKSLEDAVSAVNDWKGDPESLDRLHKAFSVAYEDGGRVSEETMLRNINNVLKDQGSHQCLVRTDSVSFPDWKRYFQVVDVYDGKTKGDAFHFSVLPGPVGTCFKDIPKADQEKVLRSLAIDGVEKYLSIHRVGAITSLDTAMGMNYYLTQPCEEGEQKMFRLINKELSRQKSDLRIIRTKPSYSVDIPTMRGYDLVDTGKGCTVFHHDFDLATSRSAYLSSRQTQVR